jgi:UDP-N-acetylmuramate dehydrogenase
LFGARTRSPYIGGINILVDTIMNILKDIKRNISLKKFTTFRIGGRADFFVSVKNIDELKEVLLYAKKKKLKVFILGGGSNIVFSDDGFKGLVIKIEIKGIISRNKKNNITELEVGSGEVFDELVSFCVQQNLYGIENLSAIPGTVGAAPVQNIGAYGAEVKDTIEWVETINIKTFKIKRFTNKECNFKYRDSFFKTKKGKEYVITRVGFKLKKDGAPNLSYADLASYFNESDNPPLKAIRQAIVVVRSKKFPNLTEVGTAGSFFKNPILTNKEFKALQEKFPKVPSYHSDKRHVKVPLGYMLDKLGWKGKEYKHVSTYKNQALIVVSNKNATRKQLEIFIKMIEEDVKTKTNIIIEKEVLFIT